MEHISFNMSARTAGLMGRESVPTQFGALIELVKNAYDADATKCIVYIDHDADKIWIIDDGDGMTSDIIKERWMVIGTDDKVTKPKSRKERVRAGAKGIGRFSLDRLGEQCEMYTKTADGKLLLWQVNWSSFDKPGVVLTDVKASLGDFSDIESVKKSMGAFKFFDSQVHTCLSHKGTVLCISKLRDSWESKTENTLKQLETLNYPHGDKTFDTYLIDSFSLGKDSSFDEFKIDVPSFEDYDYHLHATYSSGAIIIDISRNEIDKNMLSNVFFSALESNEYPYNSEGFSKDSYRLNLRLDQLIPTWPDIYQNYITENLGKTDFDIYFLKRAKGVSPEVFRYRNFDIVYRRDWLETYGGIKIFRDNFKVRPYGEGEARDWLNLSARRAQNPAAVTRKGGGRITEDQIAGAIHISRLDSSKLDDVASREGLKDEQLFDGLKQITTSLIALIERDRHYAAVALQEEYRHVDTDGDSQRTKEVKKVFKRIEKKDAKTLEKAFKAQDRKLEQLAGELSLLRGLAGIGAVTASFAHDLRGLQNKIANYTDLTAISIQKACPDDSPDKLDALKLLSRVDDQQGKINNWLMFITGAVKKDKRKQKHVNITDYLEDFKDSWNDLLLDKQVELNLAGNSDRKIRAFEIDLDSLFSNLILNSIDAFKKQTKKHVIHIHVSESSGYIKISYTDNGPGLDEKIVNKNSILEFGFSTKKDENGDDGMGLGMYIVDCIVSDNRGRVDVLKSESGFKMEILWPMARVRRA